MNYSLSDKDMLKLVPDTNIITYDKLQNYNRIDDVLKNNMCVILYLTKKNYGHWTCIFKYDNNTIQIFDSYGTKPDNQIQWIPQYFKSYKNVGIPYLTYLLYQSPYNINYNNYRLQKMNNKITTCGRWCAVRLWFKHLDEEEFNNMFKKYKNKDKIIVEMTKNKLGL